MQWFFHKGKCIKTGNWVYGNLIPIGLNEAEIHHTNTGKRTKVDTQSVCVAVFFKTDIDGAMVFTNDIVEIDGRLYVVFYDDQLCAFGLRDLSGIIKKHFFFPDCKVVGNIREDFIRAKTYPDDEYVYGSRIVGEGQIYRRFYLSDHQIYTETLEICLSGEWFLLKEFRQDYTMAVFHGLDGDEKLLKVEVRDIDVDI